MDENDSTKFTRFDKYCQSCKFSDLQSHKDPCNECLEVGAQEGTEKPYYYEPRKK